MLEEESTENVSNSDYYCNCAIRIVVSENWDQSWHLTVCHQIWRENNQRHSYGLLIMLTFFSLPSNLLAEQSGAYLRLVGNILMAKLEQESIFKFRRHLQNMVQYQYNWGPFFNYLKITWIHLYNIDNDFSHGQRR